MARHKLSLWLPLLLLTLQLFATRHNSHQGALDVGHASAGAGGEEGGLHDPDAPLPSPQENQRSEEPPQQQLQSQPVPGRSEQVRPRANSQSLDPGERVDHEPMSPQQAPRFQSLRLRGETLPRGLLVLESGRQGERVNNVDELGEEGYEGEEGPPGALVESGNAQDPTTPPKKKKKRKRRRPVDDGTSIRLPYLALAILGAGCCCFGGMFAWILHAACAPKRPAYLDE